MTDLATQITQPASAPPATAGSISVRVLGSDDRVAITRLAGVDSAPMPRGEVLGAEADGTLIAALSLSDGSVVADPFRASSAAVELLQLRAKQLRAATPPRHGRRMHLPRLQRARGALAGSPPGSGGRLLQL